MFGSIAASHLKQTHSTGALLPCTVHCVALYGDAVDVSEYCIAFFTSQIGLVLHRDDEAHSPETQAVIEQEVRRFCQTAYENAQRILVKHKDQLERVAGALLEYETLTADEIRMVMKGEKLKKEIGPRSERYSSRGVDDFERLVHVFIGTFGCSYMYIYMYFFGPQILFQSVSYPSLQPQ